MIKVSTRDEAFNRAWVNASCALPVEELESPRQYELRWREAYQCRSSLDAEEWPHRYYVFDNEEDYTVFMLRWA